MNGQRRVAVFGEPSIDSIIQLDSESLWKMDLQKEQWRFTPESYFLFKDENNITMGTLQVGKKWNAGLPLDVKTTISNHETGLFSHIPYDQATFAQLYHDQNSICGTHLHNQMGGPVRNSLTALVEVSNLFPPGLDAHFSGLFLGGYEPGTDAFLDHMKSLDDRYRSGTIDFAILRDENWAIHQAFNFIPPKGGKQCAEGDWRTLIRWQEPRKSFAPEIVKEWFSQQEPILKNTDALYINSLKAKVAIDNLDDLLTRGYDGLVIVAPTNNMFEVAPDITYRMLERADRIILNMAEACEIAQTPYKKEMSVSEKVDIVGKLISRGPRSGKRAYVSDDGYHPVVGEIQPNGSITSYALQPFEVCPMNHLNAGDNFTGAALHYDLSGNSAVDTLAKASAYASYRVSLSDGTAPLDADGLTRFAAKYGTRKCYRHNMQSDTYDTTSLFPR